MGGGVRPFLSSAQNSQLSPILSPVLSPILSQMKSEMSVACSHSRSEVLVPLAPLLSDAWSLNMKTESDQRCC